MTIYTKFTPTEVEAIAKDLRQQLSSGTLTAETLETFKFRGPDGNTWTVLPQTGAWYCFISGRWQPAKIPDTPLDGTVDLFEMITLPLFPLDTGKPGENEPPQPDSDIRQMIERATSRIRDSYHQGKINSAEAENLLKDLYLLDPSGLIWSCGMHTGEWYTFQQGDWEIGLGDGPNPLDFQPKQMDSPQTCSSCRAQLKGAKICPECGTPAPRPESPYSEAAKQVVMRFTESGAAPFPEQVVPDWKPAPGFPGIDTVGAERPMQHKKTKVSGSRSTRRTRIIVLFIFIFLFILCACLFACGIGGYFFVD